MYIKINRLITTQIFIHVSMHKSQKYSELYESFLFKKLFETNIRKDNKLKVHYIVCIFYLYRSIKI